MRSCSAEAWSLGNTIASWLALALLVVCGGSASAGGPVRTALGEGLPPGTVIDLGTGPCAFPVALTVVVNQEYDLTFPEDVATHTQRHLVSGRLVVAVSNTATGSTVTREVSGPGTYVYSTRPEDCPSGPGSCSFHLSAHGSWLFFFFPDQRGPGTPGALFVNNGRIEEDQAPDGTQTLTKQVGAQEDLCATLGP